MTRQPATLSCLAIVNPTLRASRTEDQEEDRDDADQRAQILFYTSKEHAVSQGKMLRQVGLAQALIAFSANICNSVEAAQDIHTLKCRMTLISPEPDYWVYGLFDLSRTQQTSKRRSTKGKAPAQPSFDYHDSALQDEGLRAHLQKSYEEFKLLYGTFDMILQTQGRGVLENLLERYFARWVWAWEVERSTSRFDCHALESQMHPRYSQIAEVVDPSLFPSLIGLPLIVLEPPYILWGQRQDSRRMSSPLSYPDFPLILVSHLLKLLSPNKRKAADDIRPEPLITEAASTKEGEGAEKQSQTKSKSNFRVPPMTMDPRKWALGALLTSPPLWMSLRDKDSNRLDNAAIHSTDGESREVTEGNGNASPQEADSDLSDSQATIRRKASLGEPLSERVADQAEHSVTDSVGYDETATTTLPTISVATTESIDLQLDSPASLSQLRVYLSQGSEQEGDPEVRTVGYIHLKNLNLILAVVLPNMDSQDGLQDIVRDLNKLVKVIRPALDATVPDKKTPSSTKIFASDQGVCASEPPGARFSEHAFDTWRQLCHPHVCEVISRPSVNSRPWIAGKREPEGEENSNLSGRVYLELMGSDSTLVDVDRSLSAAHSEWCT